MVVTTDIPPSGNTKKMKILAKLKEEQAKLQNNENNNTSDKAVKKIDILKKLKAFDQSISSSNSSFESQKNLAKRSTMQEQLFKMQCEMLKQEVLEKQKNKNYNKKSKQNNLQKTSSISDDSEDSSEYDVTESVNYQNSNAGLIPLHLKKPVVNEQNVLKYFDSRGRMEPINWNEVKEHGKIDPDKKHGSHCSEQKMMTQKNTVDEQNKNGASSNQIQKLSVHVPDANIESKGFINFVENTTPCDTVFKVCGNLKQNSNSIDTPILKMQRMISSQKADSNIMYINENMLELFTSNSVTDDEKSEIKLLETEQKVNDTIINYNKTDIMKKIHNLNAFESKDSLSSLSTKSTSKMNEIRNKYFTKCTDEMFNFELPASKSKFSSSIDTTSSDSNEIDKNSSSSSSLNFEKFKSHLEDNIPHGSLDSDDMSFQRSSIIEDLSVSRKSKLSKFQSLKNKLKIFPQQLSKPETSSSCNIIQQNNKKEIKKDNSELLLEEKCAQYFNKNHSKALANVKNIIKIENLNIIQNEEEPLLLKPLSTRYLKKSLGNENVSDSNEKLCNQNDRSSQLTEEIQPTASLLSSTEFFDKKDENLDSVIKGIDSDSRITNNENSETLTYKTSTSNNMHDYLSDGDIESEDEFDVVNIRDFPMFKSLVNTFTKVQQQCAKHEQSLKALKTIDNTKRNDDLNKTSSSNLKSIESSFNISEGNYSSKSASVSSNLDSDNETESVDSFNVFSRKKNIFENVNFDNIQWQKSAQDFHNTLENSEESKNEENIEISKKKLAIKNVLKNYQKDLISENTEELSTGTEQSVDEQQNDSLKTNTLKKHHKILDKIKKMNLQQNSKP